MSIKSINKLIPVLLVFVLGGCVTQSRMSQVNLLPQPEENRVMGMLVGDTTDSQQNLTTMIYGAIGKMALDRGLTGFHVYDQDVKETEVKKTYTDSEGQVRSSSETKYTIKIYAVMTADPLPNMSNYVDAAAAYAGATEKQSSNAEMSCYSTACAIGILGVAIIATAAKNNQ